MSDIDLELGTAADGLKDVLSRYPGRILVLGAGGKMGLHLCLQLDGALKALGRENDLLAVSRFSTLRGLEEFRRYGLQTVCCDLCNKEELASLPDAAIVYFLAGTKFGTTDAPDRLRLMNVEMPALVAERFKDSNIVALSTACVYPYVTPESGGARESLPVAPNGLYAETCVGREEAFAKVSKAYGTPCVSIRLSYSCEYRYGVLADLASRIEAGEPVNLTNGYANIIWQSDAIDMTARAVDLCESPAAALNVSGPEIISIRRTAESIAAKLGKTARFEGSESPTAWLVDCRKACQFLGAPATTLDVMIDKTVTWIRDGGKQWGKPTKFEVRDGKF